MTFDHERLDVYRLALDFLVFANELTSKLPRGRAHFADQLGRAGLSILLNIAEGAGRASPADKRRFYLTARGSATESAAMLDALTWIGLLDEARQVRGKEMLLRIVSMLVKLARNMESLPGP
jgi:four helix bundle protein